MLEHSIKIQKAFDNAANTYDEYADLQYHSGQKLISYLPTHDCPHIVDLGCGTGAITRQLANTCKFESLHAIDTSVMSLAIARDRLNKPGITVNNMNFDVSLPGTHAFDLAFANMSLHWSLNFEELLSNIDERLAENGTLAFSIPLADTFNELMPHFAVNHFFTAEEVCTLVDKLESKVIASEQEIVTMSFPDTLSALRYLKRIGVHHTTTRKYAGLAGKNAITSTEITTLTYQLGYFIIRKTK